MRTDEDILADLNNADIDDVLIENTDPNLLHYYCVLNYNKTNNLFEFKCIGSCERGVPILPTNTHVGSNKIRINKYINKYVVIDTSDELYADLLKFINNRFQLDVVSDWLFAGTLK